MAPANLTKLVADKLKQGENRRHDLAVHGASLPARVAQVLGRPEAEAPIAALLAEAGIACEQNDERLGAADGHYLVERGDDAALRAGAEAAEAKLYSKSTGARAIVGAVHGPAAVRAVGFEGETPADLGQLTRLAPVVVQGLKNLPPPPAYSRLTVDVEGLCADLEEASAEGTAALTASKADQRENEAALRARNDTLATAHRAQVFLGELLRLCAMTVGDDDLQHRLRDPASSGSGATDEKPAVPEVG